MGTPTRMIERLERRALLSAGDLSPYFGQHGVQYLQPDANISASVVFQDDGKTIIGGTTTPAIGNDSDIFLERFNVDGTPDTSFGDHGRIVTDVSGKDTLASILLPSDGRILAVGASKAGSFIIAYTNDGTIDPTYAAGGKLISTFTSYSHPESLSALKATLLPDNSVVIVGATSSFDEGEDSGAQVVNPDGSVTQPVMHWSLSGINDYAADVAALPDGQFAVLGITGGDRVIVVIPGLSQVYHGINSFTPAAITSDRSGHYLVAGSLSHPFVTRLNADGTVDTTFGSNGTTTFDSIPYGYGYNPSATTSIRVAPDGSVIIAGTYSDVFSVFRLNPNGSVDQQFAGGAGVYQARWPGASSSATALAISQGGKIVVAGNVFSQSFVAHLNPDGTPDASLAHPEAFVGDYLGSDFTVSKILPLPDDRYILAGSSLGPSGTIDFYAVRYFQDGTRDSSFGSDGRAFIAIGLTTDIATDAAIAPDGSIVIAGHAASNDDATELAVARFTSAGLPDATFGGGTGYVTLSLNHALTSAANVGIQSDGRIVLIATTIDPGIYMMDQLLVRLTVSGQLDPTFGDGSPVEIGMTDDYLVGAMLVQPDDRIDVAADFAPTGGTTRQLRLMRYTSDGHADQSFNGSGSNTLLVPGSAELVYTQSLALQNSGKILVAGDVGNGYVVRFNSNGTLDTGFADGGAYITPETAFPVSVATDAANRVLLVYYGHGNYTGLTFGLMRLTADGQPDSTFATGGLALNSVPLDPYAYANGNLYVVTMPDGDYQVAISGVVTARYVAFPLNPTYPATPSDLTITPTNDLTTMLKWSDNSNNETAFRVERSTDGVNYTIIATLPANPTVQDSYVDLTFSGATTFYYRVRALNAIGNSDSSNVVTRVLSFLPIMGTSGDDNITLRLDPSQANLLVYYGAADNVPPTYSVPVGSYNHITISTGAGNDTLTLDLTNGNPIPAGGVTDEIRDSSALLYQYKPTQTLQIIGDGSQNVTYAPIFTPVPPDRTYFYLFTGDVYSSSFDIDGRTVRGYMIGSVVVRNLKSLTFDGRTLYVMGINFDSIGVRADGATTVSAGAYGATGRVGGIVSFDVPLTLQAVAIWNIGSSTPDATFVPITLQYANYQVNIAGGIIPLSFIGNAPPLYIGGGSAADPSVVELSGASPLVTPAIHLSDGGTLRLTGGLTLATALDLSGNGTIDLVDGALLVENDQNSATLTQISAALNSAYDHGRWDGVGITSSTARDDMTFSSGITVGNNALLGYQSFMGAVVDSSTLIVRRTLYGDVNLDGKLNADDVSLMLGGGTSGPNAYLGDLNHDGHSLASDDWALFNFALATHSPTMPASPKQKATSITQALLAS